MAGEPAVIPFLFMRSSHHVYPVRMFIRHKVRGRLIAALRTGPQDPVLDGLLLWDVTNTRLQPSTHPDLYRPYPSRALAAQVEEQTADDIAEAYIYIKRQSASPHIQALNRLL